MLFAKKTIYLTYSDTALKLLVVQGSRKPKIIFYDQKSLSPGIVFDDKIADLVVFKDEVRKFTETNQDKLKTRKIIVGINEQDSFFSSFTTPATSKGLESELTKSLNNSLPFNLSEGNVRYYQRKPKSYQVEVVRNTLLFDHQSVFKGTSLQLAGLLPVPLAILNFLAFQNEPYVYIICEDKTLIFSLVVANIITFSSTLKLAGEIKDSSKDIVKTVHEIVDINSEKNLKNIYCSGKDCELLTEFLKDEAFNVVNLALVDKFKGAAASDLADYTKALLLALAKESRFSYQIPFVAGIEKISGDKNVDIFKWVGKLIIVGLVVLAVIFLVYLGQNFFKTKTKTPITDKDIEKSINKIASSSFKSQSSKSASPEVVTPVPIKEPEVVINKSEYKINILNGTNTAGLAGEARDFLVSKGYSNITVGNAAKRDYSQTLINIKPSKVVVKDDLTSTLQERYSITVGDSLSEADTYDIIIIIGRK